MPVSVPLNPISVASWKCFKNTKLLAELNGALE